MQFAILLYRNRQHTLLNQVTITNNFLRIPGKVKKSNVSPKRPTGSGSHTPFYSMATGNSFPGGTRNGV
jgi:hypothetical protein